ncbi:MAG: GDYXXLXY domain-containing protein [Pseudomonadaceae bacterium]|nr:GDYXXLXY domain-containing protein [Pseudomonadaceae bacterium]
MLKRAFYVVVALQFAVLAYMAGNREFIRTYGDEVWLPTAPIDPRDPFRGDFVRLSYAINKAPAPAALQHDNESLKGSVVYAQLQEAARGTFEFVGLRSDPPSTGTYLKGRLTGQQLWRGTHADVRYGIEQLFVQQGRGREIEAKRGTRNEIQVPMEVLVAIGGDGSGLIKDYRWGQLGAQLQVVRSNRRDPSGGPQDPDLPLSPKLRYTLANVSNEPVVINESPEYCQFVLVSAFDPTHTPISTPQRCVDRFPATSRRLAPGEEASYDIDLALPLWRVQIEGRRGELGVLFDDWNELFRLVYRSADDDDADVWQGQLPSQAFSVMGRID